MAALPRCPLLGRSGGAAWTRGGDARTRGRERSDSSMFIWEWNPAPLAEAWAGSGGARCSCSRQHPAKLRAWVVNTSRAEGCSFTQRPRAAWPSASREVPSHWLTWCPWDRLAMAHPHRLKSPLSALLLVEQRGAQRLGNLCHHPPPAPRFHRLWGYSWPKPALKMKQQIKPANLYPF